MNMTVDATVQRELSCIHFIQNIDLDLWSETAFLHLL